MRRVILLAVAVMASVVGVVSSLSAQAQSPAPDVPKGNAENGKKLYDTHGCYQCHNYAANGGGAGPRLAPRPIPFTAFSQYIREPKGQMPPYTPKIVPDQELADIYAYLLTIPTPPAADSIPLLRP
jgi:ubiquinol-cytochrome c reductase cytochrome c subunit